jgi:hypothetical protein
MNDAASTQLIRAVKLPVREILMADSDLIYYIFELD